MRLSVPEKNLIMQQRRHTNNKSLVNLFTWNLKAVHFPSLCLYAQLWHRGRHDFFLGAFAKLRKATLSFVTFVLMEKLAFPLDGFSLNLVFEYFYKICREKSSLIKIGQV